VLWGISGTSSCWSDGVAFLTGAGLQYGNLGYFRDKRYSHAIIQVVGMGRSGAEHVEDRYPRRYAVEELTVPRTADFGTVM
jgi:hypothetical protein